MKPLYSQIDFNNSTQKDKLLCECDTCGEQYYRTKQAIIKHLTDGSLNFCNPNRQHSYGNRTKINVTCLECGKIFEKFQHEVKRNPNNFCTRSCAASYRNKHKTKGNRRSKLELWIQEQLTKLYPNLEIHYNKTSAINSELDIYIPSLNLAFELNGVFHYEPIYGVDKLQKIQENDQSKSKACHDAKIDLCIIDTSAQKYVKPSTSQKYLDIILNIIKERLLNH